MRRRPTRPTPSDALADQGASKALKLDECAVALGSLGKGGGRGSQVHNVVAVGDLAGASPQHRELNPDSLTGVGSQRPNDD